MWKTLKFFCCLHFERQKWHRNKELTAVEFEPGPPGSEITWLPTKPQALDEFRWLKRLSLVSFYMDPWTIYKKCSAPDTSRKCTWRQRDESFDPPFIIRTEKQDGSSVCSRRLGKKFVFNGKILSQLEAASSVPPRIETFARCPRVVPSAAPRALRSGNALRFLRSVEPRTQLLILTYFGLSIRR